MPQASATLRARLASADRLAHWAAAAAANRRVVLLCRLGLAVYVLMLLAATHFPAHHWPGIRVPDKIAHFGAYGLLATLVVVAAVSFRSVRRLGATGWATLAIGGLLLLACFGLCDEWTQPIVGRQFDWLDWAADLGGIAAAVTVAAIVVRKVKGEKAKGKSVRKQAF
jgi:VanZ family protein